MSPSATHQVNGEAPLLDFHKSDLSKTTSHRDGSEISMIPSTNPDELHDLICVGFGPASLSIATALHDALETAPHTLPGLNSSPPKVAFLERQPRFAWHAGMQLPGARMQISWLKDLATLRNPRSPFTFINYLFCKGRLVHFTNLGTFLPLRFEYEDYMKWCAGWFKHLTSYNQEVQEITPEGGSTGGKEVNAFVIKTKNLETQQIETRRTKHVVIACGGRPKIPASLPQHNHRVVHSSNYNFTIPKMFTERQAPYRFAVAGSGQSAAELFNTLYTSYPNAQVRLLIHGEALKPSDDSPFVNEIFDPNVVDDFNSMDPEIRSQHIAEEKATNYGVVRIELLEKIYEDLYEQSIRIENPRDYKASILAHRNVVRVEEGALADPDQLRLHIEDSTGMHSKNRRPVQDEIMDVDALIIAAGYEKNIHERLLSKCNTLKPDDGKNNSQWDVRRDYSVVFEQGRVSDEAGVWLQGCNESTHGLSDTLLSILATRGDELVHSIFGESRN